MPSLLRALWGRGSTPDLASLLAVHTLDNPDFWNFDPSPARSGGHAFFQYPAMMVPELQGTLLDDLRLADPSVELIYDPFMGSGTVMLESLYRGLGFHGSDINPMAVLLSHVKSNPPSGEIATAAVSQVVQDARARSSVALLEFPNRKKWFQPSVATDLTRLRCAIQDIPDLEVRRFLWVCMAETVRLVSNSRTSTFKLHVYSPDVAASRHPEALDVFNSVGKANARHTAEHWARVVSSYGGGGVSTSATITLLRGGVEELWSAPRKVDALMTSPPYGDNRTTVPYGQHSYLPLRWIDSADLVGTFDADLLSTTARIDSLSLGGSLLGADGARAHLELSAPSLKEFLFVLGAKPTLRKKVLSFVRDYELALKASSERLKPCGYSFWTLGERRVNQQTMPLVSITRELLESFGHSHVSTITRVLPLGRKRMAGRNSLGDTMATEQILVMQKDASSDSD